MAAQRSLNILWITSDQHSSHALGCYGNSVVQTPALDALAAQGMAFDQHYCSYPVCVPARFTMMTGLYAHHHGAATNSEPLPLRVRTVAHHFAHAGYVTAWIGKMHPVDGQTHGFDYLMDFGAYYDYLGPKQRVFTYGMGAEDSGCGSPWLTIFREHPNERSPWVPADLPRHNDTLEVRELLAEPDHFESFVAREMVRFLEQYGGEPFFAVASFLKPHNPFSPPAEFAALYDPAAMPLPEQRVLPPTPLPHQVSTHRYPFVGTAGGDAWLQRFIAAYYGNVSHMDACAGRIVAALDRLGLAERTLVVYTTDHGEMLGEQGLRGKFCFYEGSARLPLIARLPGTIPAGVRTEALVDQADFVPTFLDLAGIEPAPRSQPLDGASFAPVLRDPASVGKPAAFGEYSLQRQPFYLWRTGPWKYVRYTAPGVPEELYDLSSDPKEQHNCAELPDWQVVLRQLRSELEQFLLEQSIPLTPIAQPG
ncbi:MAG: sulfatase-like hydrolase/transferase [Chloroflexi bacterium]|nr:sulfatase-like hydrolase/transferase [Chloroflexota bacterium]